MDRRPVPEAPGAPGEGTISWHEVLVETRDRLAGSGLDQPTATREARWIVDEASGATSTADLEALATVRGMAHHDAMVERRCAGEPLQYVLGHWPFRGLDLMVDRRVLIPRPETEVVAGLALGEVDRLAAGHDPSVEPVLVADLGTGSGVIGLSVAAERVGTRVWCTDASADALAVARANCVGLGRPAQRVTVVGGSWFDALPDDLRGRFGVIASNPPYVAEDDVLPPEVVDWEPGGALFAAERGMADLRLLVDGAWDWLVPGGALVLEMAPDQTGPMAEAARVAGYVDVSVHRDLADRDRALVARRS